MLEIFQKMIGILTTDTGVLAVIPKANIFTGPVDVAFEKQADLLYPAIVLSQVSEAVRTVPLNARDTLIQLDIWSRTSQLELEQIYEAVLNALNYDSGNQGSAHIFWQRLGGAVDLFESDIRVFHRSLSFTVWSIKP